jgi:hypothetical protein
MKLNLITDEALDFIVGKALEYKLGLVDYVPMRRS